MVPPGGYPPPITPPARAAPLTAISPRRGTAEGNGEKPFLAVSAYTIDVCQALPMPTA